MALLKCVDCNSNISSKAKMCPHCGCPVVDSVLEKKKKITKKIMICSIVVIFMIIGLISAFFIVKSIKKSEIRKGLYKGIEWGVSKEQVVEKFGSDYTYNKEKSVSYITENFEGLNGVKALEVYKFNSDNELNEISILLTFDDSNYSLNSLSDKLCLIFDEKYGEHKSLNTYSYGWETSKSNISIIKALDTLITVSYKDKNVKSD